MQEKVMKILYTNWKGETRVRHIIPQNIFWGTTKYHTAEQWLLKATDAETGSEKTFAMREIDFIFTDKDMEKLKRIREHFV